MLIFESEDEARKWGQENLKKHGHVLVLIKDQKYLLCCDDRVYEEITVMSF